MSKTCLNSLNFLRIPFKVVFFKTTEEKLKLKIQLDELVKKIQANGPDKQAAQHELASILAGTSLPYILIHTNYNLEAAREIFQECITYTLDNIESRRFQVSDNASLVGYFFGTVLRRLPWYFSKENKKKKPVPVSKEWLEQIPGEVGFDKTWHYHLDPDKEVVVSETSPILLPSDLEQIRRVIDHELEQLPEQKREIVRAYYFEGLSVDEIVKQKRVEHSAESVERIFTEAIRKIGLGPADKLYKVSKKELQSKLKELTEKELLVFDRKYNHDESFEQIAKHPDMLLSYSAINNHLRDVVKTLRPKLQKYSAIPESFRGYFNDENLGLEKVLKEEEDSKPLPAEPKIKLVSGYSKDQLETFRTELGGLQVFFDHSLRGVKHKSPKVLDDFINTYAVPLDLNQRDVGLLKKKELLKFIDNNLYSQNGLQSARKNGTKVDGFAAVLQKVIEIRFLGKKAPENLYNYEDAKRALNSSGLSEKDFKIFSQDGIRVVADFKRQNYSSTDLFTMFQLIHKLAVPINADQAEKANIIKQELLDNLEKSAFNVADDYTGRNTEVYATVLQKIVQIRYLGRTDIPKTLFTYKGMQKALGIEK